MHSLDLVLSDLRHPSLNRTPDRQNQPRIVGMIFEIAPATVTSVSELRASGWQLWQPLCTRRISSSHVRGPVGVLSSRARNHVCRQSNFLLQSPSRKFHPQVSPAGRVSILIQPPEHT